jgi:hypothetical protein
MHDRSAATELGERLLRQGLSRRQVDRVVREIAEHREDLEAEARSEGHSPEKALSVASQRLGDVEELAWALMAARRSGCWPGRHPVLSFVCLPLPLFVLLFLGLLWLGGTTLGVLAWSENRQSLPEPNWATVRVMFYTALALALGITASLTSWFARSSHCGFRWALIGCSVFFLHGLIFNTGFVMEDGGSHCRFWMGYRWGWPNLPEIAAWTVALLAVALFHFRLLRSRSGLSAKTASS